MGSHTSPRRGGPRAGKDHAQAAADDLRRLVRALRDSGAQAQRDGGLSGAQLFVLRQLEGAPALSVNVLAARTLTHQSSVSVVAQRLVEAGLVQRRPGKDDARRVELSLTLRGRRVLGRAPAPFQEQLFAALRRLPARTQAQLAHSLAALVAGLSLGGEPAEMFLEEPVRRRRSARRG